MNKRYAQLTKNGWINIDHETAEAGGLRGEKAYAFCYTNLDYAGGGIVLEPGIDTDEDILDDFESAGHDDYDGNAAFWPEDIAGYIARECELYLTEDDEYNDVIVPLIKKLSKVALIDKAIA